MMLGTAKLPVVPCAVLPRCDMIQSFTEDTMLGHPIRNRGADVHHTTLRLGLVFSLLAIAMLGISAAGKNSALPSARSRMSSGTWKRGRGR